MSYTIERSGQFKKSFKKCVKRGLDIEKFKSVLSVLVEGGTLPSEYSPHKLSGKYTGCWECHIEPDWLLVWKIRNRELVLVLVDTGSHADIFG